jgi:hypothetical protein
VNDFCGGLMAHFIGAKVAFNGGGGGYDGD